MSRKIYFEAVFPTAVRGGTMSVIFCGRTGRIIELRGNSNSQCAPGWARTWDYLRARGELEAIKRAVKLLGPEYIRDGNPFGVGEPWKVPQEIWERFRSDVFESSIFFGPDDWFGEEDEDEDISEDNQNFEGNCGRSERLAGSRDR